MIGIKVEKKNQYQKDIKKIPCPKEVTLSYPKGTILKVKCDDLVKTGTVLGIHDNDYIISSVTGKVVKIKPKIVIKTDKDKFVKLKKTNFLDTLKQAGIYGLSGSFKPTYQK